MGLGSSCDILSGQNLSSQTRKQLSERSAGYRPPATPAFMANNLSGDVSNLLFFDNI